MRFMIPGIISSVVVGMFSCGFIESVSPIIILNILWLICPCLRRIGD